jgi:hypothetical protein
VTETGFNLVCVFMNKNNSQFFVPMDNTNSFEEVATDLIHEL